MIRRTKWLLGFSIIFWLLVIMGVILLSVSVQKVPIQSYGLRAYFFSPSVDPQYYLPGLYHVGVGYYFITLPSSKQYVTDSQVEVINLNMEKVKVTYSLCYRINPANIYNLYQTMGYEYEQYLIAAVNNIISGVFIGVQQSGSRVTTQTSIINTINANNDKISTVLGGAVVVEGLWVNQLTFSNSIEGDYQNSLSLSDSYQESYQTTQIDHQKTKLQSRAVREEITLKNQQLIFNSLQLYHSRFSEVISSTFSTEQERQTRLSAYYAMKRIWTYYNSSRMIFE